MNIKAQILIIMAAVLLAVTGCSQPQQNKAAWDKISELEHERTDLKLEIKNLQAENKRLKEQFASLLKLDQDIRLECIATLGSIDIDRRSGFFDKDQDGVEETLIVYIRPRDDIGDVIKAPGDVNIQLWDLSKDEDQALLGEWEVKAKELKQLWMGMVMTHYYRIPYKIPNLLKDGQKELTLKVTFTDYLTGKVFTKQKVIKREL